MTTSGKGSEYLVAAHPANLNAARHGLYSDRPLAPRIEAYREALLALPHVKTDAAASAPNAILLFMWSSL